MRCCGARSIWRCGDRSIAAALTLALASIALPATPIRPLDAQEIWRPDARWLTIRTEHFDVHFPEEFEQWSTEVAQRLESVRGAVGREVGSLPKKRVTVLVADPLNLSNGSAWPFREAPAIILWPTPPDPRSFVGDTRSWPEVLSVHEFAHLAHLMRPGRSPRDRIVARLLPLGAAPIALKSPRWVIEGYATYIEGRLTGSGRPHGVWRPATLRQWALEGRLPSYDQLSGWGDYNGGAFAYLGGSAFLEWLAARRGDSTVVHLWRRMTARTDRTFDQAFAGVYGGSPRELYGRFSAELTGRALDVERNLRAAGLVEGTMVQHLAWTTGDPAVSRDGARLAVVLRSRDTPGRIVLWSTADEPEDSAAVRRRADALRKDPEDVPAVRYYPPPKKPLATLRARDGRAYDHPRFLADGRLLVTRFETMGDGSLRPDLYLWDPARHSVRRVTRAAGIRSADPAPDGQWAAATRCLAGRCDLVRVWLADGRVDTLASGTPTRAYYRPRVSPDGRSIAVSVSDSGRWRLQLRDGSGSLRFLDPADGVNRYDGDFTRDGTQIVHVSEAGGIPNLALLDLSTGQSRILTRVTGAAVAPSPTDSAVFFLTLHAAGYDVRRLSLAATTTADRVLPIDSIMSPAVQRPVVPSDSFPARPLPASRAYGLGPREFRLLNAYALGADGKEAVGGVASTDKVGRLIWTLQGAIGSAWRPRGAALSATYRGMRPWLDGEIFSLTRNASRQRPTGFTVPDDDVDLRGATVAVRTRQVAGPAAVEARAGASLQTIRLSHGAATRRDLAFLQLGAALRQRGDERYATERVSFSATHGGSPDSLGTRRPFTRSIASASLAIGTPAGAVRAEGAYGITSYGTDAFERFTVGGSSPSYVDDATLSQWVAMPALPFATLRGRKFASYRVALGDEAFSPFFWAGTAGDDPHRWIRVLGVEGRLAVQPIPVIRLPAAEVRAGTGYTLDDPWRKRLRAWMSLRYRP